MDVAAYIKELLYREHFIYVPGLGTFLTRKTAGVYNQEQQCFYPPKNSIDFVAEEKQDEMLENYIKAQKNISQTAARYFIEKFVDELKNDLINKNISVKEALFFAENEASSENKVDPAFDQKHFGLPPIHLSAIKKVPDFPVKEAVTKQEYAESLYKEFSENKLEEQENIKPKRSTGFWASIFLLLLVCILGCYVLYLHYPDLYSRFLLAKQPAVTTAKKPVADTMQQLPVTEKQTAKDTATGKVAADTLAATSAQTVVPAPKPEVKDTTAVEATDPDLVEKSPYEIIGAAFKTLKGAKTFLNQLKAKGMHRAKILKNTSGKATLVTFGSFKDKETAKAALEKLHAKDVHSEAYIQHYK